MSLCTMDESKAVGWDDEIIEVMPSREEVQKADRIQLLRWYRFLASSDDVTINAICTRLKETFPEGGLPESGPAKVVQKREIVE